MTFIASVEQASDGSWTATIATETDLILGEGDTKDAALASLHEGVRGLAAFLRSKGQTLPESHAELIRIEVAA